MSGEDGPDGEDEARPDGGRAGDVPPFDVGSFRVPDDARDLEEDRQAWLAEVVARERERRRTRRRRLLARVRGGAGEGSGGDGGDGHALRGRRALPLLALALVAVVAAGLVTSLLGPDPAARPRALDLATSTAGVGTVGGLVPDSEVRSPVVGTVRELRVLRPALLALVPPACSCLPVLREADTLAARAGLRLWLVADEDGAREALQLAARATGSRAGVLEDLGGELSTAVGRAGTTLVLVGADGLITEVLREAQQDPALGLRLGPVLRATAAA